MSHTPGPWHLEAHNLWKGERHVAKLPIYSDGLSLELGSEIVHAMNSHAEREVIERAADDHAMHEFYCGLLRQLVLAARSYRTVFPPTVNNRVSMDAADTLDDRLRETEAFLDAEGKQ